ncbi:MAG: colanic acid biosynthesis acetyltransferase WcaF [Candidatus Omnitrophica bacterium]|nr:colanic acid biosynthesis acetyltransferase WcaF [Candidatus Omnitrophota bacterium]
MKTVRLDRFKTDWYNPGGKLKRIIWYLMNSIFFKSSIPYPCIIKKVLLRSFGAKVAGNIVVKPSISIKYPWFLTIGDNVWLGENVWIDNLADVKVGNNVCISQGAYITTGNHNYKKETFDLIVSPITIEDGVWVGARAIICPGVTLKTHCVISAGSVVTDNTNSYMVYQGNPAKPTRERKIE